MPKRHILQACAIPEPQKTVQTANPHIFRKLNVTGFQKLESALHSAPFSIRVIGTTEGLGFGLPLTEEEISQYGVISDGSKNVYAVEIIHSAMAVGFLDREFIHLLQLPDPKYTASTFISDKLRNARELTGDDLTVMIEAITPNNWDSLLKLRFRASEKYNGGVLFEYGTPAGNKEFRAIRPVWSSEYETNSATMEINVHSNVLYMNAMFAVTPERRQ